MPTLQQRTGRIVKHFWLFLLALAIVGAGQQGNENPVIPQNLQTAPRQLCVHLQWDAAGGSMGYELQRARTPSGPYETLPNVLPQLTLYNDFVGEIATNLYYRVRSIQTNGAGHIMPSDWSKPVEGYSEALDTN